MPKQLAQLKWTEVTSTNVQAVAFDPPTETLMIRFQSGGLYAYHGADLEVFTGLVHAESVGEYFAKSVKGMFPYTRWFSEPELLMDLNERRA